MLPICCPRVVWFPDPSCMGGAPSIQEGSGNQTSPRGELKITLPRGCTPI